MDTFLAIILVLYANTQKVTTACVTLCLIQIDWTKDPRFCIGWVVLVVGFLINVSSDNILIHLRQPGETGYKIPRGGLFRYVSCPHYLGEIIEWTGFALLSW